MINYFLKIEKKYLVVLLIAFICGLIFLMPYVFFVIKLGQNYQGIMLTPFDAEDHYLSMINEVSEGHIWHNSTYLFEYKDIFNPLIQYTEILFGFFVKYSHISIVSLYVSSKFIFSFINFILWYYFSLKLSKNNKLSLLSALLFSFGSSLLTNIGLTKQIDVVLLKDGSSGVLTFSRFINPLGSFLFFIGALISCYNFFEKRNVKYSIIAGIFLGINFYIYFYFWSYLIVLYFLIFLYFLLKKLKKEVLLSLLSIFTGFIIGFYYIYNMGLSVFYNYIGKATSGMLLSIVETHRFVFSKVFFLSLFFYMLYFFLKKYKKDLISAGDQFVVLLIFSIFIATNQQLVTGKMMQEGHYHWYITTPIFFLVLSIFIFKILDFYKNDKIKKILFYFFVAYLLYFGFSVQLITLKKNMESYAYYQNYGILFNWLNKNSVKDSVVFANDEFSNLLPVYTSNNPYYSGYASYYASNPKDRRLHAVNVYYFLNYRDKDIIEFSKRKEELGRYALNLVYYRDKCGRGDCYPDELLEEMKNSYKQFGEISFEEQLKKYKVDYFVWDQNKNPEWKIDDLLNLELITSYNNIYLFKVI